MSVVLYDEVQSKIQGREEEDNYIEIPNSINDNIKQPLRPYQIKSLENFIYYMEINKKYKAINNKHLLFHMATGSGKTNIIASTILYLYSKGYRNFIFFVNTNNIITKTKQNLINRYSSKYLFKDKINIDNKKVNINVIDDTFDEVKKDDINILFTTIHKLHGDLETTVKENSITYADFEDKKLVLLADEAHHLNANTATQKEKEKDWETTTQNLLNSNKENILLEFTATQDMQNKAIFEKYQDKMIYDYPLKKFRADRYSKEIRLINSGMEHTQRMLLAIMISEYRQITAQTELNKFIKPVVLIKNPKNTDDSDKNHKDFIDMIDKLRVSNIDEVFKLSDIKILDKLHELIKDDKQKFIDRLKYSFNKENLILIHSKIKNKDELMQKYLNSLEDERNHIRVIFAVDILNEGWDVLNLYDIVKLDEAKTTPISTTSEAQLIGRGARYYPFEYEDKDKYKRKFDDVDSDIRVLEEMCFYSVNKSDYIDSLTKQLRKIGLISGDDEDKIYLELKDSFKQTHLYKNGYIYQNEQLERDKEDEVFGIDYYIKSYKNNILVKDKSSNEFLPFEDDIEDADYKHTEKFSIIDNQDIVRVAINKKPFFYFSNLKRYFPNVLSISRFIKDDKYLGSVTFSLRSTKEQILTNKDKINLVLDLLSSVEKSILKNSKEYIGSNTFIPKRISHIIQTKKAMKKIDSDSDIDIKQPWYVFNKHDGTSEELHFVDFIHSNMNELNKKYDDVKLIRNEKAFKIFTVDKNKNGDRFEPDFVLMLKSKEDGCYHQIFCEPKGNWAKDDSDGFERSPEKWKEDFLKDITRLTNADKIKLECVNKDSLEMYDNDCYKLYGLPFYNDDLKDKFDDVFQGLVLN